MVGRVSKSFQSFFVLFFFFLELHSQISGKTFTCAFFEFIFTGKLLTQQLLFLSFVLFLNDFFLNKSHQL